MEHRNYWHMGRMMSREQFEDEYSDCAAQLDRENKQTRGALN